MIQYVSTMRCRICWVSSSRLFKLDVIKEMSDEHWHIPNYKIFCTQTWEDILLLPPKISTYNGYREMQYSAQQELLHIVPNAKQYLGSEYIVFGSTKKKLFWRAVCKEISLVTRQPMLPSPLPCLLGSIPESFTQKEGYNDEMGWWWSSFHPSVEFLDIWSVTSVKLRDCIGGRKWEKPRHWYGIKWSLAWR